MRRLNDPYPLPVSWAAADPSLTNAWDSLVKLAASGAGWPAPPPAGTWAAGPDDLAGEGGELVEVLPRVPTGRLVVLGEQGAGKTMLMVRLVLDLLAGRAKGDPVPVLASIASWNPDEQDLEGWLAAQLLIEHAALDAPPPADRTESTQAAALLASGLILPVLDGLDEIPERVRGSAISRINDMLQLRPRGQVVVTCRTQQYQDAVRPEGGAEVTLLGAAAVQLRPLDADTVRGYLCDGAAGPVTKARWAPVLDVLGTEAPAGQTLSTPLMVGLAHAIYNPRSSELAETLRHPAELCSPALTDRKAVESLLFDAFIPAAYQHDPDSRWKAQDAEKWLIFLARHLEYTSADLAWWQLPLAVPGFMSVGRPVVGAILGAVFGAVWGAASGALYGAGWGWVYGAVFGAGAGVQAGSMAGAVVGAGYGAVVGVIPGAVLGVLGGVSAATGWSPRLPSRKKVVHKVVSGVVDPDPNLFRVLRAGSAAMGWSPTPVRVRWQPPSRKNVVAGVVAGVVVGAGVVPKVGALGKVPTWVVSWIVSVVGSGANSGIVVGTVVGVAIGFLEWAGNQEIARFDISAAASPPAVLAREDRRTATALGALFGAGAGILAGILAGIWLGAGAGAGVLAGAVSSFVLAAWPSFEIARIWLALRHRLPWPLMGFLADAHRRGVLRRAGAFYQFRHIELQHRLAARP